ncbi:hypothetical protein [Meiothermus sp. CFH 77666]|uniref:hypothetical protein n=1 Tax=Meiothermus sp. CFH 77666 TaxID=2817942 RepID=UPI001AA0A76A|nr:hypothetical protein [Meiothermus sp. CFH 77666]MBO1435870.1 hypothetical protein [Meiothermus sp. CFH 77666]
MDKTKRLPKQRATFLVRCWLLPGGGRCYQVRHVQSGLEAQTDSLEAALQWIEQFRPEQSKPE